MSYSNQLKKVQNGLFGGKQTNLAKALGKSPAQVNQWINGYRNLSDGMALIFEKKLNLPDGFLSSNQDLPENLDSLTNKTNMTIECLDVFASCGDGEMSLHDYPEIVRKIEISNEYIEKLFGHRALSKIKIINTTGDSMEPTIPKYSAVFIDTDKNTFYGDGIYLFYYRGDLYLKRLQKTPDGLRAISDNKKYENFYIQEEYAHEFNIIGSFIGLFDIQIA